MATFLSQIAKITDHLYLSSFVGATELNVTKFGITCVITVCKEVPKLDLKNVESVKLEVVDRPTESLIKYFDFVTDKIKEVADKNGACLVHCVAGVSRSATMVLAYLMKHCKLTLRDAHTLVKSKRPFIRPNLGFWKQLVDYEYQLFGRNSIKIIPSNIGFIPDIYENEVKSMVWAKNANSNNNNTNSSLLAKAFANLSINNDGSKENNNNNYNQHASNFGLNHKEKLSHKSNQQVEKQALQPIIGSAIPKFSPNLASKINAVVANDSAKCQATQGQYTTTYRTSYQKH